MMDFPPWWYRERFATPLCKYRDGSVSLEGWISPHRGIGIEGPPPNRQWGKGLHPGGSGHRETMKNPLPLRIWEMML